MSTTPPKDTALKRVAATSAATRKAESRLKDLKEARDQAMFDAQATHGATYPELAQASSLTRDRVSQVLAKERQAHTVTIHPNH